MRLGCLDKDKIVIETERGIQLINYDCFFCIVGKNDIRSVSDVLFECDALIKDVFGLSGLSECHNYYNK